MGKETGFSSIFMKHVLLNGCENYEISHIPQEIMLLLPVEFRCFLGGLKPEIVWSWHIPQSCDSFFFRS